MDIIRFYEDYHIDYKTEGHHHCRPGWVNIECPFCAGNPGYHLGFPLDGNIFVCWRCGTHSKIETISELANVSNKQAFNIIKQYTGKDYTISNIKPLVNLNKKRFLFPNNTKPLIGVHKKYLRNRGFDPDFIQNHWEVLGTGPLSIMDKIDYKWRLVIPITWQGRVVSFQTRDITKRHPVKYISCPKNREIVPHKHILYGNEKNWEIFRVGICVEGVTDVWKLGDFAFALFGIKYTKEQMRLIAKKFDKVCILFDDDPQAQKQAQILKAQLELRGLDIFIQKIDNDPGSLSPAQATKLIKSILTRLDVKT